MLNFFVRCLIGLFGHSTFNGHPRFWGVITSSAAPIGALGDLLAASVNPNVGGWIGGPMANEIEVQTIRWIAELLTRLQRSGEAFLSNAVVRGTFLLRACIVNFRTCLEDIEALPGIVTRIGREVDVALRPLELHT